jgi:hypothetical protein
VEVTPFGAQNIGWKFYIVWTCANAAFLPVIYFLYPETGISCTRSLYSGESMLTCWQPTAPLRTWTHTIGQIHRSLSLRTKPLPAGEDRSSMSKCKRRTYKKHPATWNKHRTRKTSRLRRVLEFTCTSFVEKGSIAHVVGHRVRSSQGQFFSGGSYPLTWMKTCSIAYQEFSNTTCK